LKVLAPYAPVYAPDLPGAGRSSKPRKALTLTEAADSLAEWMDAMGIRTAHLVGNSYGCQVVTEFAVRYPKRLERMVLQGPTVNPHKRGFFKQLVPWFTEIGLEPFSFKLLAVLDLLSTRLRFVKADVRNAFQDAIEAKLPYISAPSLVVCGAKDPLAPEYWAKEAAALLPKGDLRIVPGMAHVLIYTAPLELLRIFKPFFGLNQEVSTLRTC
ncbi:MAG: alpha/beta fold hydrolase, partial [Limisphaerales bacterium]